MIYKHKKGFTLIELLVVIGILAILLSIALIAINPARQFGQANNVARRSAILQILNAVGGYVADNKGNLPSEINGLTPLTPYPIDSTQMETICEKLVIKYMPALPTDPSLNREDIGQADCDDVDGWDTGFEVSRDATNRVTIYAPSAENGEDISITR